jgi:hypothetical protein
MFKFSRLKEIEDFFNAQTKLSGFSHFKQRGSIAEKLNTHKNGLQYAMSTFTVNLFILLHFLLHLIMYYTICIGNIINLDADDAAWNWQSIRRAERPIARTS